MTKNRRQMYHTWCILVANLVESNCGGDFNAKLHLMTKWQFWISRQKTVPKSSPKHNLKVFNFSIKRWQEFLNFPPLYNEISIRILNFPPFFNLQKRVILEFINNGQTYVCVEWELASIFLAVFLTWLCPHGLYGVFFRQVVNRRFDPHPAVRKCWQEAVDVDAWDSWSCEPTGIRSVLSSPFSGLGRRVKAWPMQQVFRTRCKERLVAFLSLPLLRGRV